MSAVSIGGPQCRHDLETAPQSPARPAEQRIHTDIAHYFPVSRAFAQSAWSLSIALEIGHLDRPSFGARFAPVFQVEQVSIRAAYEDRLQLSFVSDGIFLIFIARLACPPLELERVNFL
jgi:hypothetical protein